MREQGRLQELYTPLELAGRDIYIAEGCYNCHSQMIRTLVPDVLRYGNKEEWGYSRLGESIYDRPFQWGSKRTGPDLAREGLGHGPTSRNHSWHWRHMMDPRSTSPGSNMPPYPWLYDEETDFESLPRKIAVQRRLGTPWPEMTADEVQVSVELWMQELRQVNQDASEEALQAQAQELAEEVYDKEIIALIAYLLKLGAYTEIPAEEG